MNAFIINTITCAATAAGLPADKVMEISEADGLTLPRPRLEYRFLPEVLTRSGKKLSITRKPTAVASGSELIAQASADGTCFRQYGREPERVKVNQTTKRELYTVKQDVLVNIFAKTEDGEGYLAQFCPAFVAALPRGGNDAAGNWVVVRANKATQARPPVKRVGTAEIRVLERLSTLYQLQFTGRITADEVEGVILDVTINAPKVHIGTIGRKDA